MFSLCLELVKPKACVRHLYFPGAFERVSAPASHTLEIPLALYPPSSPIKYPCHAQVDLRSDMDEIRECKKKKPGTWRGEETEEAGLHYTAAVCPRSSCSSGPSGGERAGGKGEGAKSGSQKKA